MTGASDSGQRSDLDPGRAFEGLFAIVVNWNGGAEDNRRCLASILEQGVGEDHIVFVDNDSRDGSREVIHSEFPSLQRIDNGTNLGFGEAANQGAERAASLGAFAVVFVNNDLWFPEGEPVLRAMTDALAAEPKLGMVGPRVLFGDGSDRVWCAGGRLDFRQNVSTLLGNGEPDGPGWRRRQDVDYIAGCALVLRGSVLASVGDFRADYFAYMEDVELGLRVREAGWGVVLLGEHRVYHAPSSATGGGYGARRKWMQALNSVRFMQQYGTPARWARFVAYDVLTLPLVVAIRALRGEGRAALAKAKGLLDGFRGRQVTADALEPGGSRLWPK